ncbi:MAG: DUF3887 domain-containing protein [Streptosporangiaceae bacterium]
MEGGLGDFGTVTSQLATQARLLAEQAMGPPGAGFDGAAGPGGADEPPDLGAVRVARELGKLSYAALRLAVERAQSGGHSWEEIGERLGVSPQAAYQRFGRRPTPPGEREEPVVTDAANRAVAILAAWFEERYDEVSARFDDAMVKTFPLEGLEATRAQAVASAGPYQRLGDQDPLVRQAGDYTVADVPLLFETGLMKGRVSFDRDARVAGLYVLPLATP